MSERGVFAVDRGIWDHPAFAKEPFTEREAWIWLVGKAAFKPYRDRIGAYQVDLDRGQIAVSIRFLAKLWKWDRNKVFRFLTRLKTETMIETVTETGISKITICNYENYQKVSLPNGTAIETVSETEARQKRDKLENIKNIKDIYTSGIPEHPDFAEFWKWYPRKVGKHAASKAYTKARKEGACKEEILKGVTSLRSSQTELKYTKHPATWLNGKHWTDEAAHISPKNNVIRINKSGIPGVDW